MEQGVLERVFLAQPDLKGFCKAPSKAAAVPDSQSSHPIRSATMAAVSELNDLEDFEIPSSAVCIHSETNLANYCCLVLKRRHENINNKEI